MGTRTGQGSFLWASLAIVCKEKLQVSSKTEQRGSQGKTKHKNFMKPKAVTRSRVYELKGLGHSKQGTDCGEEPNLGFFKL